MKIIVVCGHYGVGKTNFAVNLAEKMNIPGNTALIDMDVVNPYFRSSDYTARLESKGIHVIAPPAAGTTIDAPYLSPEIDSAFTGKYELTIIDAGGDDAGATALGVYSQKLVAADPSYEMLYVINMYRQLTRDSDSSVEILREIEAASRLKVTAIVNNSHLCGNTTDKTVADSLEFSREVCEKTGLPLKYTAVLNGCETDVSNPFPVSRVVLPPWDSFNA